MAILLLAFLLADLLSLALLGTDIYLWREWYLHKDTLNDEYARRCLWGAIALLFYLLVAGRSMIKLVLSKQRKTEDEPVINRSSDREELRRADGSLINIEHYGTRGRQSIVFIHGWNSNSMQWYYQKKYFASNYHLILIDLPGLGKSSRPKDKDFSLENLAAVLNDVLEHTRPVDPILWGHSIGGMTILTYCKVYREKLTALKGIILQHTTYTDPSKTAILNSILPKIENPVLKPLCWLMIVFSPLVWLSRWMSYSNGNMLIMTRFLTYAGTQTPQQLDFTSLLSAMAPPAVTARGVLGMFNMMLPKFCRTFPFPHS
jgi:pimeloyl-ACP methyl ester carboxylesterase